MIGQGEMTVRVEEKTTPTGFAWNAPDQEFECVTLDSTNFGDFNTGFQQWKFTAKDEALECEEIVKLTRSSHAPDAGTQVDFTIKVDKRVCDLNAPESQCPDGETLNANTCACMTALVTEGDLVDLDAHAWHRDLIFFAPGDKITMRESSASPDGRVYTFGLPSVDDLANSLECVTEISRADTGY